MPSPVKTKGKMTDLTMPEGRPDDTEQLWMNPESCLVLRLLKDGRYVLYRVDAPSQRILIFKEDLPVLRNLFTLELAVSK